MFCDKNGTILKIGDYILPDIGRKLKIISIQYVEEIEEDCMFGQQVEDSRAISVLTRENLKKQWTRSEVV